MHILKNFASSVRMAKGFRAFRHGVELCGRAKHRPYFPGRIRHLMQAFGGPVFQ